MKQKLIYFNSRDYLIRVDISKIVYFEGDGNYTYIVTANKLKSCLSMNLAHTENALAAQLSEQAKRFMRIGKRYIVNIEYIYQVDLAKLKLTLTNYQDFTCQLPISKEALKVVKELIIQSKL